MKKKVINLLALAGALIFCLIVTIGLNIAKLNSIEDTPIRKKEFSEVSVNAVSVYEVKGVMKMVAINYLPDEFAELNEVVSGANDGSSPVKKGTYRFCIDTLSDDEWNNADSLQGLSKPDGNWHLTMYIPPVFSACSVYVRYQNKEYIGTIDKYNVEYYGSFSAPSKYDDSVSHKSATQPIFIDIPVSSDHKYSKECIVTLHYEADNENFVGISDYILIGEDAAVRKAVESNRSLLLIGAIVGSATLLLFLFICILKRSITFVPQLLFAAGVFLALFSVYSMFDITTALFSARLKAVCGRNNTRRFHIVSSEKNRQNTDFTRGKRNCRSCKRYGVYFALLPDYFVLLRSAVSLCRFILSEYRGGISFHYR